LSIPHLLSSSSIPQHNDSMISNEAFTIRFSVLLLVFKTECLEIFTRLLLPIYFYFLNLKDYEDNDPKEIERKRTLTVM